jgi:hypothetical protein
MIESIRKISVKLHLGLGYRISDLCTITANTLVL